MGSKAGNLKRLGKASGLLVLGAMLALGGCGRRGSLDAPGESAPVAEDPAVVSVPYGAPAGAGVGASSSVTRPAPAQTGRFPLDFLI
ncbi:lipoprotein [Roseibium suaedae]|uniref:lipoprotein n=1 Tax=Roseibium suaedae TaxID=735517 RepID=UPI00093223B6|nr:lipoprotein [Roseibium suaedae]